MSPRYYPTYHETEDTSPEWHDWLVTVQYGDDSPYELADVTDVCASARCKAVLYDDHGVMVGVVDAMGDYSLGN